LKISWLGVSLGQGFQTQIETQERNIFGGMKVSMIQIIIEELFASLYEKLIIIK
jgi:hypothetical protein